MRLNPVFKDIPWLGSKSIDLKEVDRQLKQILENEIDTVKDRNIEEYLKLRDFHRKDMVLLSLSKDSNYGIKTKSQLLIAPNYYQRFNKYMPQTILPVKIWGALYTDWGTTVAACQARDIERAIKIKPTTKPVSEAEHFACAFISYHEGCHYLQNQYWRKGIKYFQEAKSEIINRADWCQEIDRPL